MCLCLEQKLTLRGLCDVPRFYKILLVWSVEGNEGESRAVFAAAAAAWECAAATCVSYEKCGRQGGIEHVKSLVHVS